jgi:hypothetical protein
LTAPPITVMVPTDIATAAGSSDPAVGLRAVASLRLDNELVWSIIEEADSSVAALSSAVLSQPAAPA